MDGGSRKIRDQIARRIGAFELLGALPVDVEQDVAAVA